ncbi:hypothetical protein GGX14DRAFT_540268 [Mycena pura]|uniref:DUF6534 domain-containing protein n=1 Tax=Mycena pura TaxID=153505 RepID=A0AAD6YMI1_9AGAR|nr:hypothetical protein GGX14DRAFT_540268 [Mycena pura]
MDIGQLTIPLFVGTVMNWALLGALAVQVYLYFFAFTVDQRINRFVVIFVIIAEALQTLGDSRNTIRAFGAGWGDPNSLDQVGWAWFSVPVLGSLIGCVGQAFFAWRIYIISSHALLMPIIIGLITLFQLGAGIWTGVQISRAGRFSLLSFKSMKPPVAWLSATALADLLIVAGTVYYLLKARQPGLRSTTQAAVNRIIKVTIETGVPCAAFALVDLALFVKYNGNNYHLGTCIWLSKVYSNSIMVILNSRAHIGHDAGVESVQMTGVSYPGATGSRSHPTKAHSTIHFATNTTTTAGSVAEHDGSRAMPVSVVVEKEKISEETMQGSRWSVV